jgi:hypothetical protein
MQDDGECIQVYGQIVARDTFNDFYMVPIVDILSDVESALDVEKADLLGHIKCFNFHTLGEVLDIMGPTMSISAMRQRLDLTCFVAEFRDHMPSEVSSLVQDMERCAQDMLETLKHRIVQIQDKHAQNKTVENMARLRPFLASFERLVQLQSIIPFEEATFQDANNLVSASAAFLFMVRSICRALNRAKIITRPQTPLQTHWMVSPRRISK